MTPDELQALANAQGRGYLKAWKANSILMTVKTIPEIGEDRQRLRAYVANCLEMEGFTSDGIDAVTAALAAIATSQ
jgi:hypothetical protein